MLCSGARQLISPTNRVLLHVIELIIRCRNCLSETPLSPTLSAHTEHLRCKVLIQTEMKNKTKLETFFLIFGHPFLICSMTFWRTWSSSVAFRTSSAEIGRLVNHDSWTTFTTEFWLRYLLKVGSFPMGSLEKQSALCRYDVQFGINSTDMKHMTPSYSSVWPVTLVRLVVEQYCSTDMRTEPSDQLPMPQRV